MRFPTTSREMVSRTVYQVGEWAILGSLAAEALGLRGNALTLTLVFAAAIGYSWTTCEDAGSPKHPRVWRALGAVGVALGLVGLGIQIDQMGLVSLEP